MFDKKRRFSYADQKYQRHRLRWVFLWMFLFFVIYTLLTSLFFSMRVLENETMLPGLQKGDKFIFSSYQLFNFLPGQDINSSLHRGNVVLVDKSLNENRNFFNIIFDNILRFITLQRLSLNNKEDSLFIKRIIGLPGDEITMINFIIRVKPKDELYSFTDFELWDRPYELRIPSIPALWDESLPFSGNMDVIVLGEGECFVLSDDRSNTNDSRSWGAVSLDLINGKALFRYWPFTRAGIP